MFEIDFQTGQTFFRFKLNFQILKLYLRFQKNANEFSRDRSFGHKINIIDLRLLERSLSAPAFTVIKIASY